jgi:hypothetical protein
LNQRSSKAFIAIVDLLQTDMVINSNLSIMLGELIHIAELAMSKLYYIRVINYLSKEDPKAVISKHSGFPGLRFRDKCHKGMT